ncbi:DUF6090 family protein [Ichthyenterobacterium sp. W332]|uniref:DUF6090 family protein n=1 Tax=Microcosmobacter mediterraneus TaxID=3075607 RepID=A0ABU2YI47_9FLAO|nr:DUF6090 family protein [Ichthyenterobacterium sp. W332]MDT0557844.1 DUF6090 family protein [Ichthyenterobacterium sp. W332]
MIKFFRHIRKSLIEQNNMGKYFKYAIGEILLVVIGILIALQINNWNENRKADIREQDVLEELKQGLVSNKNILEKRKLQFNDFQSKSKKLIDHLEAQGKYHDSLDAYFYVPTGNYSFGISYATFENLKSQGLDIISNKDLRLNLVKLYEEDYWLLKDQETKVANAFTNATLPFTRKHFKLLNGPTYKPNDYDNILQNAEFLNILYESNYLAQLYFRQCVRVSEATSKVIEKIDEELKE